MKRVAEHQATRDDVSDDDIEEISPEGFKKADASVLASRPMKGIPKRALASSPTTSTAPTPMAPSKSAEQQTSTAFKGFGSAANNHSFSFTPPTTSSSYTPPSAPHHQSNVSNDAVLKASPPTPTPFGSTASSIFSSALASSAAMDTTPDIDMDVEQAAIKYYTSIRGLNRSFVNEMNDAFRDDAFVDFASALTTYKQFRDVMQKDFDDATKPKPSGMSRSSSTVASSSTAPIKSAFSMPVPPKTFSGFGPSSTTTAATEPPATGGFKPQLSTSSTALSSTFSFATPPAAASDTLSRSSFTLSATSTSTTPSGSIFGFKDSSESSSKALFGSKDNNASNASPVFGSSSSTLPSSSSFSTMSKTPSAFSGGTFGLPKSTQSDGNGTSSGTPLGGSAIFPSASKAATGFGFGSHTSLSNPGGSIFGNSKGSIGNPVGFSFGTPTPGSESASGKDGPAVFNPFASAMSKVSARSEGTSSKALSPLSEGSPGPAGSSVEGGEDEVPKVLGSNPHDEEGEGEEDEVTTHTSRLKVYKLKQADGKTEWGDMGIGMLRLKKHKTTDMRRVLLRNSGNGKIVINFKVYPGMVPSQSKNTVSFVGHENGEKATYRLRLKTEADARDLKEALDKEIASVKAAGA